MSAGAGLDEASAGHVEDAAPEPEEPVESGFDLEPTTEVVVPSLVNAQFFTVKPSELRAVGMLGQGAYAEVYKAEWTRTFGAGTSSIIVAVKRLHNSLGVIYRDKEALTLKTDHPNLVKCFDCTRDAPYLIISEYCAGGSLFDQLYNTRQELTLQQIIKILADISAGMKYLHERDPAILHRDLKSSNVLLMKPIRTPCQDPVAKVADFGLARAGGPTNANMTIGVGTWRWMAPEVYLADDKSSATYDVRIDVFSFAMIVYEVLARRMPFIEQFPSDVSDPRIGHRVCCGLRPNMNPVRSDAPEELVDMMKRSWHGEREERPFFSEIDPLLNALIVPS